MWWMGTYSMVLSKAAFFHRKYLDLYTHKMPSSIHDYVTRERSAICIDYMPSFFITNDDLHTQSISLLASPLTGTVKTSRCHCS